MRLRCSDWAHCGRAARRAYISAGTPPPAARSACAAPALHEYPSSPQQPLPQLGLALWQQNFHPPYSSHTFTPLPPHPMHPEYSEGSPFPPPSLSLTAPNYAAPAACPCGGSGAVRGALADGASPSADLLRVLPPPLLLATHPNIDLQNNPWRWCGPNGGGAPGEETSFFTRFPEALLAANLCGVNHTGDNGRVCGRPHTCRGVSSFRLRVRLGRSHDILLVKQQVRAQRRVRVGKGHSGGMKPTVGHERAANSTSSTRLTVHSTCWRCVDLAVREDLCCVQTFLIQCMKFENRKGYYLIHQ